MCWLRPSCLTILPNDVCKCYVSGLLSAACSSLSVLGPRNKATQSQCKHCASEVVTSPGRVQRSAAKPSAGRQRTMTPAIRSPKFGLRPRGSCESDADACCSIVSANCRISLIDTHPEQASMAVVANSWQARGPTLSRLTLLAKLMFTTTFAQTASGIDANTNSDHTSLRP